MLPLTSILLLTLPLHPIQAPAPVPTAGETAIRAIVAEQAEAWNAADAKAYARHLAADVSFTNLFGMVISITSSAASAS